MVAVVIGGANVDVKARGAAPVETGTSNPGTTVVAPGGVGRNIAENLARLGTSVRLVAAVGDDVLGDFLVEATAKAGVDVGHVTRSNHSTGTYTAVLDAGGELLVAVSDMAATDTLGRIDIGDDVDLLVLDGNLAPDTIGAALDLAAATRTRVVIEPVSVPKARRLAAQLRPDRPVFAVTPNADELVALAGTDDPQALHDRGVELVWVRLGDRGSLLSGPGGQEALPAPAAEVRDVTGAGDAMTAAFCHAILGGADPVAAARYGHAAAALTVASPHTVRPDLAHLLGAPP